MIQVSGFKNATITDVDLVLKGFSHTFTPDVDVMLAAPDGRNALVMSDVGGAYPAANLTIRLEDAAVADLPSSFLTPLISGTYRPTNVVGNADSGAVDSFDTAYAPVPSGNVALSTFDGGDPNGEWRLFIRNDRAERAGNLSGGWELTITATIPAKKTTKKKR